MRGSFFVELIASFESLGAIGLSDHFNWTFRHAEAGRYVCHICVCHVFACLCSQCIYLLATQQQLRTRKRREISARFPSFASCRNYGRLFPTYGWIAVCEASFMISRVSVIITNNRTGGDLIVMRSEHRKLTRASLHFQNLVSLVPSRHL